MDFNVLLTKVSKGLKEEQKKLLNLNLDNFNSFYE